MSFKDFSSNVKIGTLEVDTVIERPALEEGETLNGTVYLEDGEDKNDIDFIELKVVRLIGGPSAEPAMERTIAKQTLEFAGAEKSKGSLMLQFEIIPDERWTDENDDVALLLRTTVYLMNGEKAADEDTITYTTYES